MLKWNFRSLFVLFGVILFLFVFIGCYHIDENMLNNKDNFQKEESYPNKTTEYSELSMKFTTNMASFDDDKASFRANPYIQEISLSWEYSLDVVIEDGKIYINDILYDQATSANPVVLYSEDFLNRANDNQELSEILKKIEDSESCYILETDHDSKFGKKIAVYEIDNAYYFLRFYENGEVMRIHRAKKSMHG